MLVSIETMNSNVFLTYHYIKSINYSDNNEIITVTDGTNGEHQQSMTCDLIQLLNVTNHFIFKFFFWGFQCELPKRSLPLRKIQNDKIYKKDFVKLHILYNHIFGIQEFCTVEGNFSHAKDEISFFVSKWEFIGTCSKKSFDKIPVK